MCNACACVHARVLNAGGDFDTQKAAICWNKRVSYWNRLLCLSRKVIHGKGKTWHAQKQQNRCGIVWVETVKIRWLAMKLKVAHMDAGGRKWCAQRQQSRIMQMLGNKLPIKHKKRSDFTITSNVWVRRFELPASWTPFKHATKLRYTQSCSEGFDSRRRGQPCEQN